jgi:hypothetical protein
MLPEVFLVERAKYCDTAEFTCNCMFCFSSLFWHLLYSKIMNTFNMTKKSTTRISTFLVTPLPPVTPIAGCPMSSLN